MPRVGRRTLRIFAIFALLLACGRDDAPAAPDVETLWLSLGGETFTLEVALDPGTRQKGLSGRPSIPRNSGMLFVQPRLQPIAMVMRDCPKPIDVAFLDAAGRVVAMHAMQPEPPRRHDETPSEYERRLRPYPSRRPVQFAIEIAGGRLAELGIVVGERIAFDGDALARRSH